MTVALLLVGLLAAIVLSGFFSGSETGIYCLNHVRLRVAVDQGHRGARKLEYLMRRPEDLVITALLGTNVADYLATAFAAALFLEIAVTPSFAEVYATALVTPLILVFGGIVPKDWFRREANQLMTRLSPVVLVCLRGARATGLVWLLRNLTRLLVHWLSPGTAEAEAELLPRARTLHLLREGAARGGLTALQRDLIERVLNLSEVRVADVLVPRHRTIMIRREIERDEFLRIARRTRYSRLPVYRDDPRRIVGVVNVIDVLADPEERPIAAYVRPPLTLGSQTRVSSALLRMQSQREVMAVVEDQAGQCLGILTLKDLVEEIVGELEAW